jgi:hypothetical protein
MEHDTISLDSDTPADFSNRSLLTYNCDVSESGESDDQHVSCSYVIPGLC